MKRFSLFIFIVTVLLLFTSCYNSYTIKETPMLIENNFSDAEIKGVQYVRTDGYNENFVYPRLIRITCRESLLYYYSAFNGIYSLGKREKTYSDSTIGFADAMAKYDSDYFKNGDLYLAVIEEGSGSVRHLVEDVEDGYVEITSLIPEVCTDDMAEWHIILEVNKGGVLNGINKKEVPIYTPEDIYAEFLGLLKTTAIDYLNERGVSNAHLAEFTKTDFGKVSRQDSFENPLGYNPGYPESPVWQTTATTKDLKIELYLCDSPFVFGYKNIPS